MSAWIKDRPGSGMPLLQAMASEWPFFRRCSRAGDTDERVVQAILTINGIAAGLRNSG